MKMVTLELTGCCKEVYQHCYFLEVFLLLCTSAQSVVISKSNTVLEFVGIQYLWLEILFLGFCIK